MKSEKIQMDATNAATLREGLEQLNEEKHPLVMGWNGLALEPLDEAMKFFWAALMQTVEEENGTVYAATPTYKKKTKDAVGKVFTKHTSESFTRLIGFASKDVHKRLSVANPVAWRMSIIGKPSHKGTVPFFDAMLKQGRFEELKGWIEDSAEMWLKKGRKHVEVAIFHGGLQACDLWTEEQNQQFRATFEMWLTKEGANALGEKNWFIKLGGINDEKNLNANKVKKQLRFAVNAGVEDVELFKTALICLAKEGQPSDVKWLVENAQTIGGLSEVSLKDDMWLKTLLGALMAKSEVSLSGWVDCLPQSSTPYEMTAQTLDGFVKAQRVGLSPPTDSGDPWTEKTTKMVEELLLFFENKQLEFVGPEPSQEWMKTIWDTFQLKRVAQKFAEGQSPIERKTGRVL
jgi:hypothetical protein